MAIVGCGEPETGVATTATAKKKKKKKRKKERKEKKRRMIGERKGRTRRGERRGERCTREGAGGEKNVRRKEEEDGAFSRGGIAEEVQTGLHLHNRYIAAA